MASNMSTQGFKPRLCCNPILEKNGNLNRDSTVVTKTSKTLMSRPTAYILIIKKKNCPDSV
jgi:hypothetical protein